jgi:hypothetical protein
MPKSRSYLWRRRRSQRYGSLPHHHTSLIQQVKFLGKHLQTSCENFSSSNQALAFCEFPPREDKFSFYFYFKNYFFILHFIDDFLYIWIFFIFFCASKGKQRSSFSPVRISPKWAQQKRSRLYACHGLVGPKLDGPTKALALCCRSGRD